MCHSESPPALWPLHSTNDKENFQGASAARDLLSLYEEEVDMDAWEEFSKQRFSNEPSICYLPRCRI